MNPVKTMKRAASVLLASVVISGCVLPPQAAVPELSERVDAARQRSDHAGLVAYFKEEAAAARNKANWHRRLAASYSGPLSSAGGGGDLRMAAHCESIAQLYEPVAVEYEGMADFHPLLEHEPALRKP